MGNLLKSSGNQLLKFQIIPTYEQYDGFTTVNPLPTDRVSASSLGFTVDSKCHGKTYRITNGIEEYEYYCNTDNTFTAKWGNWIPPVDWIYIHCITSTAIISPNYEGKYYSIEDQTWHDSLPTTDRLICVKDNIPTQIVTAGGNTIDYVYAFDNNEWEIEQGAAAGFAARFNNANYETGLYLTSDNTERRFAWNFCGGDNTSRPTGMSTIYVTQRDVGGEKEDLLNNYIQICITNDYHNFEFHEERNLNDILERTGNPVKLVATLKFNKTTNKWDIIWTTSEHY